MGDPAGLAQAVADAFCDVGLWPLLWRGADDPADYLSGGGDVDRIDAVDVTGVLAMRWRSLPADPQATEPFAAEFPRLTPATPRPTHRDGSTKPFARLAQCRRDPLDARLLLVPCNRAADALTVLGFSPAGRRWRRCRPCFAPGRSASP